MVVLSWEVQFQIQILVVCFFPSNDELLLRYHNAVLKSISLPKRLSQLSFEMNSEFFLKKNVSSN